MYPRNTQLHLGQVQQVGQRCSQFLTRSVRRGILGSNYRWASGKCQHVSVRRVSYLLSKLGFSWNKHRKSFGVFQTDVLGESFSARIVSDTQSCAALPSDCWDGPHTSTTTSTAVGGVKHSSQGFVKDSRIDFDIEFIFVVTRMENITSFQAWSYTQHRNILWMRSSEKLMMHGFCSRLRSLHAGLSGWRWFTFNKKMPHVYCKCCADQ